MVGCHAQLLVKTVRRLELFRRRLLHSNSISLPKRHYAQRCLLNLLYVPLDDQDEIRPHSPRYDEYLHGMANMLRSTPRVCMDVINELVRQEPVLRTCMLHNLMDVDSLEEHIDRLQLELRYGLGLSRQKWLAVVNPVLTQIGRVFNGETSGSRNLSFQHVRWAPGVHALQQRYKEESQKYAPHPQRGTLRRQRDHLNLDVMSQLQCRYYSISNFISLHLATDSIRNAMRWLRIEQEGNNSMHQDHVMIGKSCMLIKLSRDGFTLQMGRTLIQTLMTNISVRGLCNSTKHTEICGLASTAEDNYTLHLLCQQVDKEVFLLRVFGIVDPKTGTLILPVILNVEDSGSAEKSYGRNSANSDGKWMWSKFGKPHHLEGWHKWHMPFSTSAEWCHLEWRRMKDANLIDYCNRQNLDPYLAQFKECPPQVLGAANVKAYAAAQAHIKKISKKYGYTIGEWLRAESALASPLEPFHMILRNSCLMAKYMAIGLLQYNLWINLPEQAELKQRNHGEYANRLCRFNQQHILSHFKNHCGLDIYYDAQNPTNSKITARMYLSCFLI